MRIHLEVASGPLLGKVISLEPGDIAMAGSGRDATLCVPGDRYLADRHFSIACGPEVVHMFAQPGASPVTVNSVPAVECELQHLDWIVAGSTLCRAFVSGQPEAPEPETPTDVVARTLMYSETPLYMIVDGWRAPGVLKFYLRSLPEVEAIPLFLDHEEQLRAFGWVRTPAEQPWLLRLNDFPLPVLSELVRMVWGRNFSVFMRTRLEPLVLRTHLARFLYVDSEGDRLALPYWTPGLLHAMAGEALRPPVLASLLRPEMDFFLEGSTPYRAARVGAEGLLEVELCAQPAIEKPLPLQQDHLFHKFPGYDLDPATVVAEYGIGTAEVERSVDVAKSLGIRRAPALAQYVLLEWEGGDLAGELRDWLARPGLTADAALDLFTLALNQNRMAGRIE